MEKLKNTTLKKNFRKQCHQKKKIPLVVNFLKANKLTDRLRKKIVGAC